MCGKDKKTTQKEIAFQLFGEMRCMNEEEREWYEKVWDSIPKEDTGLNIYDIIDNRTTEKLP